MVDLRGCLLQIDGVGREGGNLLQVPEGDGEEACGREQQILRAQEETLDLGKIGHLD